MSAALLPLKPPVPPTATRMPPPPSDDEPYDRASADRLLHAALGKLTSSVSPASLCLAYADWALHLAASPGKLASLAEKATRKSTRLGIHTVRHAADPERGPCVTPLPQDNRFRSEAWSQAPFDLVSQAFLLTQQWWHNATTGVPGVSPHHEQVVSFVARQILDMMAPSNFLATNPELIEATFREGGQNLVRGAINLAEDWERAVGGRKPLGTEAFIPGETVAATPGAVVRRNRLAELIQYAPTTPKVGAEPILIVPAWIMKYYILDLSPANSLVKHLVDQGHTVFVLSWHNPVAGDRDLGLDDYLRLGILDALEAIGEIVPDRAVHLMGYCLGGTLAAIAAAYLGQRQPERLASLTLLAAQTDFTEAGELTLFLDESQLAFLEDIMWDQGYLDTRQMAGAFQLLRSTDLVWSRVLHEYLMGRREPMNDMMAWNADATRMPARMHSEYLRRLFVRNDLFEGRLTALGRPVALEDIRVPVFAVGTETDHVAPWRSVYKIHLAVATDVTFLLTSGGHNAGIVSEPGHPHRSYRVATHHPDDPYEDPASWLAAHAPTEGSWWPEWARWIDARTSGAVAPPAMNGGRPVLGAAPGTYVHEA